MHGKISHSVLCCDKIALSLGSQEEQVDMVGERNVMAALLSLTQSWIGMR